MLAARDGRFLLKLAREAITTYLKEGRRIEQPEKIPGRLRKRRGVFVALNKYEEGSEVCIGCMGYPLPMLPLVEVTIDSAISAAIHARSLNLMGADELRRITLEISVLTRPKLIHVDRAIDYPKKIKIGQDGLMVERGFFKGLLLPQVPIKEGWSEEDLLSECCTRAGLLPDSWLEKDTKIYKFKAEIFHE